MGRKKKISNTDSTGRKTSLYNERKASPEKEVYLNEILPLLLKIKTICIKNKFPMFFTVCIHPNGGAKGFETVNTSDFISPFSVQQTLNPDYVAECIKVLNGYKTYLPEDQELDMEIEEEIISEDAEE